MKSKLLILACAAVVIMLCACQPLNVTSEGSDVVSVAFKVTDEGVSAKAITIGNPLDNANVLYQYKAIPSFTPDNGKQLIGATGDIWTSLPSVYNGSEFKMKFSKGPWTFYFRGVDKNDLTPLYKIAAPVKITLSSKSTMDIVFNMEVDPEGFSSDTGNGFGTILLDIAAQCNSEEGELVISYSTVGNEKNSEDLRFTKPAVDGNKSYFIRNFELASGNYIMNFTYHDQKRKTPMGPYLVQVMPSKTTSITGRIAHESKYITDFSTPGKEFNYRATFDGTAVSELKIIDKIVDNQVKEDKLKEALEANNKLEEIAYAKAEAYEVKESAAEKQLEEKQVAKELIEKQKIYAVLGQINFALETLIDEKEEVKEQEKKKEVAQEAKKAVATKKIGIIRELICGTEAFNLENYFMGQENGTSHYSIPEQLFKDIDEKHEREYSPEHVITLRVVWSNGSKTLTAESEPITLLFIH